MEDAGTLVAWTDGEEESPSGAVMRQAFGGDAMFHKLAILHFLHFRIACLQNVGTNLGFPCLGPR